MNSIGLGDAARNVERDDWGAERDYAGGVCFSKFNIGADYPSLIITYI